MTADGDVWSGVTGEATVTIVMAHRRKYRPPLVRPKVPYWALWYENRYRYEVKPALTLEAFKLYAEANDVWHLDARFIDDVGDYGWDYHAGIAFIADGETVARIAYTVRRGVMHSRGDAYARYWKGMVEQMLAGRDLVCICDPSRTGCEVK